MRNIKHVIFDHDGTLVDPSKKALYQGVQELLSRLDSKGIKLYVWTSRSRFSTVEFLKSLGIMSRFEQLHCSTDPCPKPETQGLKDLLDQADPKSALIVGDSFADMIGAKNFGAWAIGAVWASENHPDHRRVLKESGADFLAESPSQCAQLIFG